MKGFIHEFVRSRRVLLAAPVVLVIASAALVPPRPSEVHAGSRAGLNVGTPVSTAVVAVLDRACFDCHSDDTRWPWYTRLPVASHLISRDVTEARGQLNWSHWAEYNPFERADLLDKVCELASARKMPPWRYRALHADARLSGDDISTLCAWTEQEASRLVKGGS